jgi:hypothetical protein
MGLNCGIVGLPNVGKSTIFSALTSAPAEAANYPFCTIDPNVGVVRVPDRRIDKIVELIPTDKKIPAVVDFVDIAGLVAGASKGEGLGNRFLSHIREVGVIVHVVRCFDDPDVSHVSSSIDPRRDIETINTELALADLDTVAGRMEKHRKNLKAAKTEAAKQAAAQMPLLEKVYAVLEEGKPARAAELSDDQRLALRDLHLITMKPQIYACNVDEEAIHEGNEYVEAVRAVAAEEQARVLTICGKLEAEIAALETDEERAEFLSDAGLSESGMNKLIHTGYEMLGLRTFFTAGPKEVRAWTFREGAKAPEAAGVIHSDFQRGFIKAEVYHCEDLFELGSEQKVREAGRLRIEGKEYRVKDGDVLNFKFNV